MLGLALKTNQCHGIPVKIVGALTEAGTAEEVDLMTLEVVQALHQLDNLASRLEHR